MFNRVATRNVTKKSLSINGQGCIQAGKSKGAAADAWPDGDPGAKPSSPSPRKNFSVLLSILAISYKNFKSS